MRPKREIARNNGQSYFLTSATAGRTPFFRHMRWAELFIETMYGYRPEQYLIHGFTVMPDHFHLLLTPHESLEKAVQCLKGGFSFRAKKTFSWSGDIWASGFSDHRIRGVQDFEIQRYIARNAVKAALVEREEAYAYCSASGRFEIDVLPRGLKPDSVAGVGGAAKAAPFQNKYKNSGANVPPLQDIS